MGGTTTSSSTYRRLLRTKEESRRRPAALALLGVMAVLSLARREPSRRANGEA
jgi:hypothetical protein